MSSNDRPGSGAVVPETDPRFPSGEWTGFFLQPILKGRHWMELHLAFRDGLIRGEGRDWVGEFVIRGRYQVVDGRCWWNKAYLGEHSVAYKGFNEGKGIWGTWEIESPWRGGFHIWPVAMGDPTLPRLHARLDVPAEEEVEVRVDEDAAVPVGASLEAP